MNILFNDKFDLIDFLYNYLKKYQKINTFLEGHNLKFEIEAI